MQYVEGEGCTVDRKGEKMGRCLGNNGGHGRGRLGREGLRAGGGGGRECVQ